MHTTPQHTCLTPLCSSSPGLLQVTLTRTHDLKEGHILACHAQQGCLTTVQGPGTSQVERKETQILQFCVHVHSTWLFQGDFRARKLKAR